MKILMITSRFPYPPLKGDKIRAYYPIKFLCEHHQIDLLSFSDEDVRPEYVEEMRKYCRWIKIININKRLFLALQLLAALTPFPSQTFCYRSRPMVQSIEEFMSGEDYDIVQIICGRLAMYYKYLGDTHKVIDWIDSFSLSTRRLFEAEKSAIKKLVFYLEWQKIRRYESNYAHCFDFTYMTSDFDKKYLKNNSIQVIPNGVDTSVFYPVKIKKDIDLIFTGNMGYYPNIQALEFFCEEVFPLVLSRRSRTTLYVVGTNPDRRVLRYHDGRNIVVTGYVESINEMLNRSRVFIAPLQSGAGIQNKILEAMACSLPVISTSYGNGGVQAKEGVEILVENDPQHFADCVLQLLQDEPKRQTIGKNALELVSTSFSWKAIAESVEVVYGQIEGRKKQRIT